MNPAAFSNGWIPEPDVEKRGTASIIYTCFFTIYACTWTALHLNVPRRSLSRLGRLVRKLQWMILAVLAPEYISLTALVQRSSTVVALTQQHDDWPLTEKSRVLAFYAMMGGFELHFDDETYHRLKYSEFRALVRAGFVDTPDITAEEVTDKSKGNWFTKSLALLQIGWYVLQLLGRVAQGLETTPLELFTLGAVACTIVSYINWWAKPLDVNISTAISMASARKIPKQAFFAPLDVYRLDDKTSGSKVQMWLEGLRTFLPTSLSRILDEHQANENLHPDLHVGDYDDRDLPTFLGLHAQKDPKDVIELLSGTSRLNNTPDLVEWDTYRNGIAALKSVDRSVSRIDMQRYGRRRDFYNVFRTNKSQPSITDGPPSEGFWSDTFFEDRTIHTSSSIGLAFTTLVFGACHLLAWNYGFPSTTERILWRVMIIACTILPMTLLVVDMSPTWLRRGKQKVSSTEQKNSPSNQTDDRERAADPSLTSRHLIRLLVVSGSTILTALTSQATSLIVLGFYMTLRIYLVVAMLISLRSVPDSVYTTVDWSIYIPHFG